MRTPLHVCALTPGGEPDGHRAGDAGPGQRTADRPVAAGDGTCLPDERRHHGDRLQRQGGHRGSATRGTKARANPNPTARPKACIAWIAGAPA